MSYNESNKYSMWILLLFLIGSSATGLKAQYSHIVYDAAWEKSAVKDFVSSMNGQIKVEWPGNAWVQWSGNDPVSLPNGIFFGEHSENTENPFFKLITEGEETLECSTSELDIYERSHSKGTSDTLNGHTVCALFFVNQPGSNHEWSLADQNECLSNVALNLLWWSEQASRYHVEATFEIKPYYFDDPVCQVSLDPTIAPQSAWAGQIMQSLGYQNAGNSLAQQTAFINDLIEESESNWGFIGFIIRGTGSYRSNAYLLGPSTTCTFQATRNGLTFTHEVGHIFGLTDEYEERAGFTHTFEVNGLPNLNADYRNIVNAPCIMKSLGGPPLCSYNAYHLNWTDQISIFEIHTEPEDALFRVDYLNSATSQTVLSRIYQGRTSLPMGLGSKFRLVGFNNISTLTGDFELPIWQESGSESLLVELEAEGVIGTNLTYLPKDESTQPMSFLSQGHHYSGRRINQIDYEDGTLLMLTNHGISTNKDGIFRLFDKTTEVRPGEVTTIFRNGVTFFKSDQQQWLIGGQVSPFLPEIILIDHEAELGSWSPPNTFREQGVYSAICLTNQGDIVAAFEGGGLHHYNSEGDFQILRPQDGLPNSPIVALHNYHDEKVILGYDGGRTGTDPAGLYLLDPTDLSVSRPTDIPEELIDEPIRKIKYVQESLVLIGREKVIVINNGVASVLLPQATQVFDADQIDHERWVLATNNGIEYQDKEGHWIVLNPSNANLPDQNVRAVRYTEGGAIVVGYASYGASVHLIEEPLVSAEDPTLSTSSITFFPNPLMGTELNIQTDLDLSNQMIQILDLGGRILHSGLATKSGNNLWGINIPESLPSGIYIINTEGKIRGKAGLIQILR